LKGWMCDLHRFYKATPAMYEVDDSEAGFEWIDCNDWLHSVISFLRWDATHTRPVVCVFNFTPVPRHNYRVGVPLDGVWREALNSDAPSYGGSGQGNLGSVEAKPVSTHGKAFSLNLTLPPLSAVLLVHGHG